ncbi:unnamed protein product [Paramecium pentaurelia]|uniref:Uncharacterized protein n=1 Tax=Paramecium pentaurelia TaxID=43138 RepID=A0A8S1XFS8_9CILI|nr:unnamed protein product [Paramecium pentaurelia]
MLEQHTMLKANFMKLLGHISIQNIKGFSLSLNIHIFANQIAGVNKQDSNDGLFLHKQNDNLDWIFLQSLGEDPLQLKVDGLVIYSSRIRKMQIIFHQLLVLISFRIGEFKHLLKYLGKNFDLLDQHQEILVVQEIKHFCDF